MISTAIIILILSFYGFYHTSKKARIQSVFGIEDRLQKKVKLTKIMSSILLIISLALFITYFGIGVGTLLFFITLMTIGSLFILLYPLNLINYKSLFLLSAIIFLLEFLTF